MASTCWAADRPAALTPQEIAEGWILLFDGKSTMGWDAPNGSKWTISDGMLAPQAGKPGLLLTTSKFRDCELKLQYIVRRRAFPDEATPSLMFGCSYDAKLLGKGDDFSLPTGGASHYLPGTSGWIDLTVTVTESTEGIIINHTYQKWYGEDSSSGRRENHRGGLEGHIALCGNGVVFRSIKLRPLKGGPLFNGKDLDGWKEAQGFSVSREGWLNVRGPGELQTVDRWQDFVLQLEGSVGLRRPSGPEAGCLGRRTSEHT